MKILPVALKFPASDENQSLTATKYKVQNLRANHLTGGKNSAAFSDSPIDGKSRYRF